jgi:predicted Zn-dependent protease with MMP-like domain
MRAPWLLLTLLSTTALAQQSLFNVPSTQETLPGRLFGQVQLTGTPHGAELSEANPTPPQILLYLDNLWDYAGADPETFAEEVRVTYLHELGHFLGWDEEDLAARGLD